MRLYIILLTAIILIPFDAIYSPQGAISQEANQTSLVVIASIRGVINPLTTNYLNRVISQATEKSVECLIIELDTPGGLESAMREMVQSILTSPVPVVVYVYPSGARAASAGLFITLAAHIAVMSPGTNIGAAHPVGIGKGEMDSITAEKVVNDAAATIRSIAQLRHRNVLWAEEAVRKSVSITDEEALEKGVIDLIALNREELLEKIDGRTVETNQGKKILQLKNPRIDFVSMTLIEKFLHIITDPNIALLLLSLGMSAIVIEFYTPGSFGPAIVGIILLILGFLALGSLPINWAAILLILLAVVLIIIELYTPTFGIYAIGGIIAFILGALLLFTPFSPTTPAMPSVSVSWWLIAALAMLLGLLSLFITRSTIKAQRSKARSGMAALIGEIGVVTSDLNPIGTILLKSELWKAEIREGETIRTGEQVEVIGYEGAVLHVRRYHAQ